MARTPKFFFVKLKPFLLLGGIYIGLAVLAIFAPGSFVSASLQRYLHPTIYLVMSVFPCLTFYENYRRRRAGMDRFLCFSRHGEEETEKFGEAQIAAVILFLFFLFLVSLSAGWLDPAIHYLTPS